MFFILSSAAVCSLQNAPEELSEGVKSARWPIKCFYCDATENLKTELEKHLKPSKFRENVHCVKCGDGSFDVTLEIWNQHYADKN